MRIILQDHACYVPSRNIYVRNPGSTVLPGPKLPVLDSAIAFRHAPGVQVGVEALLDTGTDITLVHQDILNELENRLNFNLPVEGNINLSGVFEPAFDLAFIFPGDYAYPSNYCFVVPVQTKPFYFDIGNVWLGQDILSQLVVTFDGIKGTVTIIDPNAP